MIRNLSVALSLWCAFGLAPLALAAGGAQPAETAGDRGVKVYAAQRCSMCHSIEGKGNKKTPLDGVGDRLKREEIRKYIVSPREMKADTKMKAYANLPEKDLEALVDYLAGLKKK
ncbi:MAG: cytochrome c [Acidobacteria bacterium]|nr:cytochrome c [Acidobacteriota bacterium]